MQKLINPENLKSDPVKNNILASIPEVDQSFSSAEGDVKITLEILMRANPNKIVFTLKDVAKYLGVGVEFVRRRIKNKKIRVTYFGDKPKVHIAELARIITEGINGN
jgi:excisionase family DNA binding protein